MSGAGSVLQEPPPLPSPFCGNCGHDHLAYALDLEGRVFCEVCPRCGCCAWKRSR